MTSVPQDVQKFVKNVTANAQATAAGVAIVLTAGATEDAVEVTGQTIDRLGFRSCALAVNALATLAADKTLAFGVKYQDSSDGSTWNTAVVMQASTVLLTDSGSGSNLHGTLELSLDLTSLDRYIRFNITPDLNATGTDTAVWTANCTLGGAQDSADA
jgi:hypothetical protein